MGPRKDASIFSCRRALSAPSSLGIPQDPALHLHSAPGLIRPCVSVIPDVNVGAPPLLPCSSSAPLPLQPQSPVGHTTLVASVPISRGVPCEAQQPARWQVSHKWQVCRPDKRHKRQGEEQSPSVGVAVLHSMARRQQLRWGGGDGDRLGCCAWGQRRCKGKRTCILYRLESHPCRCLMGPSSGWTW